MNRARGHEILATESDSIVPLSIRVPNFYPIS
jgi:hypothetical protein